MGDQLLLKTTNGGLSPYFATSTGSIYFGSVLAEHIKKDSVWITNIGSLDLIISSITATNERFTVSPTSVNLAPSAGIFVVVTFAPLDVSNQSGYIDIVHNAAGSPDSISLQGEGIVVGVSHEKDSAPKNFSISQNYPNPFNPTTTIRYDIPISMHVMLVVYDMLGRQVETLVNAVKSPGHYTVTMDASRLPSGMYFYRLAAGSFFDSKKLIVIK